MNILLSLIISQFLLFNESLHLHELLANKQSGPTSTWVNQNEWVQIPIFISYYFQNMSPLVPLTLTVTQQSEKIEVMEEDREAANVSILTSF
jgi:hypothetical protein